MQARAQTFSIELATLPLLQPEDISDGLVQPLIVEPGHHSKVASSTDSLAFQVARRWINSTYADR